MNYSEVLEELNQSIEYLEKRHKRYTHMTTWVSMLNIVLSSSIPILITLAEDGKQTLFLVSIFSALITLLQTFKSTFHLDNKISDMAVAMAYLKKEQVLFQTRTEPYSGTDDENIHALVLNMSKQANDVIDNFMDNEGE